MNELLQQHGCSNVFHIPDGLRELMADISREVLREQPRRINHFIANYLSALLITREHGILAVKILDDLCDCRPSVSEHLLNIGMHSEEAKVLSDIINEEIKSVTLVSGKETVKEAEILKRILHRKPLDEIMTAKVCEIARNAYRDYWYRKKLLEQNIKINPDEPWEIAVQNTLNLYKKTKPSFTELARATQRIQAAYRGYYVRRKMLGHLKPKKPQAPKVDLQGPPVDIAESREIDLGPVVDIKSKVKQDNLKLMFDETAQKQLGLGYDTGKTLMHEVEPQYADAAEAGLAKSEAAMPQSDVPTYYTQVDQTMKFRPRRSDVSEPPTPPEDRITSKITFGKDIVYGDEIPEAYDPSKSKATELPVPFEDLTSPKTIFEKEVVYTNEIPEVLPDSPTHPFISDSPHPPSDYQDSVVSDSMSEPIDSVNSLAPSTAPASDVEDLAEDSFQDA